VKQCVAIGLAAAALLAVTGAAETASVAAASPETICSPIAVKTKFPHPAVYTYRIGVSTGPSGCGAARSILRQALTRPLFGTGPAATVNGWRCALWTNEAWTVSCARGATVARAYGPTLEQDPWLLAAASLTMRVLQPTSASALGFVLRGVKHKAECSNSVPQQEVTASYEGAGGAKITIVEDKPPCGNLGDSPVLAHWWIHGHPATLLEYCSGPPGCSRTTDEYALYWQEHGDDIVILTHGVRQSELLALARSMALVAV